MIHGSQPEEKTQESNLLLCVGTNQVQHHKNHIYHNVLMKYPRTVSVPLLCMAEWSQPHFQARPYCILILFEVPFQCVCCVSGEIVDPLTETRAPEITNGTEFAPEEVSSADPASPVTTKMVAATGSETSTAVHLPAVLPLGDEQAAHGHSPTSAPPSPWKKGLASQMDFSRDNSPTATGATASKQLAISPSQQSSMAETSPGALQQVAALTNAPMGTVGQGQLSSSLLVFPNQTATTRSHTAFDVPQANSKDGSSTALLAIGDASVPTANTTIRTYVETGRKNSSWSEKHPEALGSPALPGTSPAPSLTPVPARNRSEYEFGRGLHA